MIKCPHCGFMCEYGVTVCQGCQAELKYGSLVAEAFGIGCCAAISGPFVVSALLHTDLDSWGLQALVFLVAGFILVYSTDRRKSPEEWVTFVRKYHHDDE